MQNTCHPHSSKLKQIFRCLFVAGCQVHSPFTCGVQSATPHAIAVALAYSPRFHPTPSANFVRSSKIMLLGIFWRCHRFSRRHPINYRHICTAPDTAHCRLISILTSAGSPWDTSFAHSRLTSPPDSPKYAKNMHWRLFRATSHTESGSMDRETPQLMCNSRRQDAVALFEPHRAPVRDGYPAIWVCQAFWPWRRTMQAMATHFLRQMCLCIRIISSIY